MITEITIENFKSFGKPQAIPLKPITLLYGPNSSGKSSIIQLLLMLKQTLESSENVPLVSNGYLVDLGDFNNLIHRHETKNKLAIRFQFSNANRDYNKNYATNIVFKINEKDPVIYNIKYFSSDYNCPIIDFKNTEEQEKSLIKNEDILNIYDCINKEYPKLKEMYKIMISKIETIKIPIKNSIQRILGTDYDFSNLADLNEDKFVAFILKKVDKKMSIKKKNRFVEKIKIFYKIEFRLLKKKFLQYSKYTYDLFLKDLKVAPGFMGFVSLDYFYFTNKVGKDFFKKPVNYDRETSSSTRETMAKSVDPMNLLNLGIGFQLEKMVSNKVFQEKNKLVKLEIKNEDDLNKYQFSSSYKSVSDYIASTNYEFMQINLNELIEKAQEGFDNFFENMQYIPPLRPLPKRYYFKTGNRSSNSIRKGEEIPEFLASDPKKVNKFNSILKKLKIEYELKPIDNKLKGIRNEYFSCELFDKRLKTLINFKDLGLGISQIMPIIASSLEKSKFGHSDADDGDIIIIEQPEIHIHPRLQAELGSLFVDCIKKKYPWADEDNKRFIIETHSEALILRLQKLIRKKELNPEDIAVIYVEIDGGETTCKELHLDENGDFIDSWPGGFFEEGYREMFD